MKIKLYGEEIINKEILHKNLKVKLNLPEYYGNNLDSFWDILSVKNEYIEIYILNRKKLEKNLGNYGKSFIKLLKDLEKENPNIKYIES